MMGGLQQSDLIILAGRPGMGKTALATNIAYNIAKAWHGEVKPDGHTVTVNGGIVGFFSLEMSAEQLATRIIAEQTGIPSNQIRRGGISESDFEKIKDYSIELQHIPLYVDETGGLSVAQLAARARRLKRQRGLDLLVIDYLQLLQGSTRRSQENRVQEITEITTKLKALAKELNVPILALSQLSRQVESRDDKRPQLSDLRESGSIEQDADVVLFVYREEYYHQMRKPLESNREKFAEWLADADKVHGKAEVIIGKQRHGPTGTVEMQFDAAVTRFSSLARDGPPARADLSQPPGAHRLPAPGRLNRHVMSETALQPDLHPEATPAGPATETGPSAAEAGGILTISLPAIEANWTELGRRAMPSECAAVIKADGYGCGLEPVARTLVRGGLQDVLRRRSWRGATPARRRAGAGDLRAQRPAAGHGIGLRRHQCTSR